MNAVVPLAASRSRQRAGAAVGRSSAGAGASRARRGRHRARHRRGRAQRTLGARCSRAKRPDSPPTELGARRWPRRSTIASSAAKSWPCSSRRSISCRPPRPPGALRSWCASTSGCSRSSPIRSNERCAAGSRRAPREVLEWAVAARARARQFHRAPRRSAARHRCGAVAGRGTGQREQRVRTICRTSRSAKMPARSCGWCTRPSTTRCAPAPATSTWNRPRAASPCATASTACW